MSCCGYSSQFPEDTGVEVALVGRSNAGKSTVINRYLGAKMAHVSQRPGKTQTANFYGSASHKIVDLPGVGYAKSSELRQPKNLVNLGHGEGYAMNQSDLTKFLLDGESE